MNIGITDSSLFKVTEDKLKDNYFDLENAKGELKNEFEQINSQFSGNDLKFLVTGYRSELDELENVNIKFQNYCSILSKVRLGYQNQGYEISNSIDLYLNKLKEEMK